MPRPYIPLLIKDFVGENDVLTPTEIADNTGSQVLNMYVVNGGLERRLGSKVGGSGSVLTQQGIKWALLPKASPLERLFVVNQAGLWDYFGGTGALIAKGAAATAINNARIFTSNTNLIDMAVVEDKLYLADGSTDGMFMYDGTSFARAGADKPSTAPTFNAFVGAGNLNGNVAYRVTYIDTFGNESEASDASATMAPVNQNVTINIPNDTDTFRINKKLYRQGVASTNWLFVATLSATATTYTDSTVDGSLGAALTTIGQTRMPSCAHLWEHDNRLFGCGNIADPQTLFISTEFSPTVCPASPNLTLPTQGVRLKVQGPSATIIGGISHGAYCFIFTSEGGYILQGTSAEDYRLERFTQRGAVSHRAIQTNRHYLFWVASDGVYRYDGLNVVRISDAIRTFFRGLTAAQLQSVVTWIYDQRFYMNFNVTGITGKCYDTRLDPAHGWTSLRYYTGGQSWGGGITTTYTLGTVAGLERVFALPSGNSSVLQLETPAYYTDDDPAAVAVTQNFAATWTSKLFNMGMAGRDKRVHMFGCRMANPTIPVAAPYPSVSIWLGMNGNKMSSSADAAQSIDETLSPTSTGDDLATTPATPTTTLFRAESNDQLRSELFQLVITQGSGTGRSDIWRIAEADIYYTIAG